MAYIPGTLYDNFDIDGRPKTKEVRQREGYLKSQHKILHGGKESPIFEPTQLQIDKYNNWLEQFQEDIKKIIGKYRYSNHLLSEEELTSEINLSLLKKRSDLIHYMKNNKGFNQLSFKHCSFIYSRNLIKWSHLSLCNKSYVKRRVDGTVYDEEDGFKSTFEAIIDREGVEENGYNFDDKNKQKALLKIIKEYSHVLTPVQVEIFSYMELGMKLNEIADKINVTHQRISQQFIEIKNKIRNLLKGASLKDNSHEKISKGKNAIESFFEQRPDKITEKKREILRKIVHLYPNRYTAAEISKNYFNNIFSAKQIISCCVKMGWGSFVLKQNYPQRFSKKISSKILKMYKDGLDSNQISSLLNIPVRSIRSKRGHFVSKGLLESSKHKS